MNILQVSVSFYPALDVGGGVPRVAYALSKELVNLGNNVSVYTTNLYQKVKNDHDIYQRLDGINVIYFMLPDNIFSRRKFYITRNLKKEVEKSIENYDIIHLHDYRTYQNIVVQKYALKHKIPYVVQAHGSLPIVGNTFSTRIYKYIYDVFWGDNILQKANMVIALNSSEAKAYQEKGVKPENIVISPNGIDISEYQNVVGTEAFKLKYRLRDSDIVLLYVGRMHESKGIDILLYAFCELIRRDHNYKLVLVGPNGGYLDKIKYIIKSCGMQQHVILTGVLSDSEKLCAYSCADIFITPKFYGFPITFMEACAMGVPIITTNEGDALDWIDMNVGLVTEYTSESIARAIRYINNNPKLADKFSLNGRELASNRFSWRNISKYIEEVYSELI